MSHRLLFVCSVGQLKILLESTVNVNQHPRTQFILFLLCFMFYWAATATATPGFTNTILGLDKQCIKRRYSTSWGKHSEGQNTQTLVTTSRWTFLGVKLNLLDSWFLRLATLYWTFFALHFIALCILWHLWLH